MVPPSTQVITRLRRQRRLPSSKIAADTRQKSTLSSFRQEVQHKLVELVRILDVDVVLSLREGVQLSIRDSFGEPLGVEHGNDRVLRSRQDEGRTLEAPSLALANVTATCHD